VSISGQWMSEVQRCMPRARVLLFHGQQRGNYTVEDFQAADFIITTYETLRASIQREESSVDRFFDPASPVAKALQRLGAATVGEFTAVASAVTPERKWLDLKQKPRKPLHCQNPFPNARFTSFHFHRIVFDECQKVHLEHTSSLHASHWWAASGTPVDSAIEPLRTLFGVVGWTLSGRNSVFPTNRFSVDEKDWGKTAESPSLRQVRYDEQTALQQHFQQGAFQVCVQAQCPLPAVGSLEDEREVCGGMWAWALFATQYIIRHAKTSLVTEEIALPPRAIASHIVELSAEERRMYCETESQVRDDVRSLSVRERLGSHAGALLQWIDRLRRAAAHPSMVTDTFANDAADADDVGGAAPAGAPAEDGEVPRGALRH
jgi:hypothetical protein